MPPEEVGADRNGGEPVRSVVEVAALAVLAVEERCVDPRRHRPILPAPYALTNSFRSTSQKHSAPSGVTRNVSDSS